MATVLDELLVHIGPKFTGGAELRKLESGVARAQKRLSGLAAGLTLAGTAVSATAGFAVRTFLDFETAQNQLQATLNVTADDMAALREQAKLLGRTTEFSATQTTEAQVQLAQAGFDLNEILASTPAVLALASAGQLAMGEAAALTANQLRAFNLGVDQTQRVVDVLAATASSANTTVLALGPAFRQVAPIASAAGLTIEQTAGYIAILRNNGLAAEQAGTALRAVLGRLVNPSKEVRDALGSIGVDPGFVLRQVEAGNLQAVLQALRTAGLDVGDAMKLFGQEAGAAGIILTQNADAAAAMSAQYEQATGTAQRMAGVQNQGLVGSVRNLRSAFEGLQIAVGESGLGAAVDWTARRMTILTNKLTEGEPWVRKLIAAVLLGGPATIGLGAGLKALSIALGGLAPVGAVIALIGHYTGITAAAQALWNARLAVAPRLMAQMQAMGVAAAAAINTAWARLYLTLKFGGVKGVLLTLWAPVAAAGTSAFVAIKGAAAAAFATIKGLSLVGLWAGIKAAGVGAFVAIKAAVAAALGVVSAPILPIILGVVAAAALLIAAWKPVSTFFRGLWSGVADNIGRVGDAFGRLLDALGPVGAAVRGAFGAVRDGFGWLASLLPDLTAEGESFGEALVNALVAVIDAVTAVIGFFDGLTLYEAGVKLLQTLVDGIKATAGLAKEAVLSALSGVRDLLPFSDAREGPLSRLTVAGRSIMTTLASGVESAPNRLLDAVVDALPDLEIPIRARAEADALPIGEQPPLTVGEPIDLPGLERLGEESGPSPFDRLKGALPDLDAIAPPLPVGPVPAPAAAAGNTSLTVTLGEGSIVINAPGGDAEDIAERIGGELQNQWRALVEQADSRIRA